MAITVGEFTPSVSILDTDKISDTDDKIRTITNEAGTYLETETQSAVTQMETAVNTKLSEVTNNPDFTYTADTIDTMIENAGKYPIAKSSLLKGTFSLSNTVIEAGFGTKLYTGNGSTQSINAGIDLATQWGDNANETYGGLVWTKGRSVAYDHNLFDTIRGVYNRLATNNTNAQETYTNMLTSFNTNGFSLGDQVSPNNSGSTYASWIFQTTHRISGTTNHGKAYTCHYNPTTGFTIVKYEGSGIAGHEIPHHLGRKLGFTVIKETSEARNWVATSTVISGNGLNFNDTSAKWTDTSIYTEYSLQDEYTSIGSSVYCNSSGQSYIQYGWANSYYNNGVLNGNYEVGIYQGTGASGNKITTRGKPAWIMVKRLDSTGGWALHDNQRNDLSGEFDGLIQANLSDAETITADRVDFYDDNFTIQTTTTTYNASGGQYLYFVAYDNDNASGLSKYPKASETSNISVTNGVVAYSDGVGSNGANSSIENLGSTTIIPSNGWQL